jgi:hypothetical protein
MWGYFGETVCEPKGLISFVLTLIGFVFVQSQICSISYNQDGEPGAKTEHLSKHVMMSSEMIVANFPQYIEFKRHLLATTRETWIFGNRVKEFAVSTNNHQARTIRFRIRATQIFSTSHYHPSRNASFLVLSANRIYQQVRDDELRGDCVTNFAQLHIEFSLKVSKSLVHPIRRSGDCLTLQDVPNMIPRSNHEHAGRELSLD